MSEHATRSRDPLADYARKRDFGATPEPDARVRHKRAQALSFVIQRHAARQLHYDFRLELDGVLKSWAVPKGPSLDPTQRRLAVQVEDHPLDYASFHGDVPPGQYGVGHVDIWDRGVWKPVGDPHAGLRDGRLGFDLEGGRLRGRFALIRMKPRDGDRHDNWLLIRERTPSVSELESAVPGKGRTALRARSASLKTTAAVKRGNARSSRGSAPVVAGVAITNAAREVREGGGATKLDVVRYHESMAQWLLPEIANRPLALVKCPGGDFTHCFFQKHADGASPGRTAPDSPPYVHYPKLENVVRAVQNGVFEFHTWGSRFPRIDRPDRITLDLDPDSALSWPAVREAAELVRELLDELELAWFLKTTGGKGLHFVIPIARRYDWDEVKRFARAAAERLVSTAPKLFISTASKSTRTDRVFVDYLRNAEGATAVAAYSLRARAGLPVSMPVAWEDLKQDVRGAHFSIRTAPKWVRKRRADPWARYATTQQTLTVAMRKALRN